MTYTKNNDRLRTGKRLDSLEWEISELGLVDGEFGIEVTPEDVGVAQMKRLIKASKDALKHENAHEFSLHNR